MRRFFFQYVLSFLVVGLLASSCSEDAQKTAGKIPDGSDSPVSACTVRQLNRPAWYNEHSDKSEPAFSVKSEAVRLSFWGMGLEQ